jgi:hypothetical protein
MTENEMLVKKYSSESTPITFENGVWVIRNMEPLHFCNEGDDGTDYGADGVECEYDDDGDCDNGNHYKLVTKTEYRNPSLVDALRDAGKITEEEMLAEKYSSDACPITFEKGAWVIRIPSPRPRHFKENCKRFDRCGLCGRKSHYKKIVGTEYRNPSLIAALHDAGIGGF